MFTNVFVGTRLAAVNVVAAVPVSTGVVTATSAAVGVEAPVIRTVKFTAVPTVPVVGFTAIVGVYVAANDGTTESIPKPNAATATSAMRLKVVFVDICFLSISR
jgi:hypothetical protein